ncbi:hypothetical protein ACM6UH_12835 (plasmid) [Staphylococcus sp. LKG4-2]|uniref:hypothetical protein n=1 Tax=Staphylococcus sp. LKG4-2 TaxID=3399686 RepID=UPI003D967B77
MDNENKPILDNIFGKNRDQKKEYIIVAFITLYIAIRTFINQEFIYLLTFYDLKQTIITLGNIFNDLIMAYIPIGVLILTTQGAKFRASKVGERVILSLLSFAAPIIFLLIFYTSIIIENLIGQPTDPLTLVIMKVFAILFIPIKVFILVMIVFSIIFFLSLLVNNIIMIIFLLLENHKKELKTLDIGEDVFFENKHINIYNYWYYNEYKPTLRLKNYKREIYFVKVFIKNKKENEAILNIYLEDDTLIALNKSTKVNVIDGMKIIDLEKELNLTVKSEIEILKKKINEFKKQS